MDDDFHFGGWELRLLCVYEYEEVWLGLSKTTARLSLGKHCDELPKMLVTTAKKGRRLLLPLRLFAEPFFFQANLTSFKHQSDYLNDRKCLKDNKKRLS